MVCEVVRMKRLYESKPMMMNVNYSIGRNDVPVFPIYSLLEQRGKPGF